MIDQHNLSELEEMILLGLREQAVHPQGLNSSHTHGTRYPIGDPRNDEPPHPEKTKIISSNLMPKGLGSKHNWK